MRRLLTALGFLAALVGFSLLMAAKAAPAHAQDRGIVNVTEANPANVDEQPLVGNDPATTTAGSNPAPSGCTGAEITYCDVVGLQITPPSGVSVFDAWFVYVEVSWNRDQPGGCDPVDGITSACNDVDIFTYNAAGGDTGDSASSSDPEVAKLFGPDRGLYDVVINNFAGVNQGYHVKAYIKVYKGEKPFELLAPTATPSPGDSGGTTTAPVDSFGNSNSASTGSPVDFGPNGPALDTASIAPDASFADFPIPPDQFAAPAKGPALLGNLIRAEAKPPKAVSGLLLIVAMVVVPLLSMGAIFGWAYKRRQSAFIF